LPDHYITTATTVKEPPGGIAASLKFLGPGFILSASIVGSGELIATTTLGAKAGFTAFWVIIVSCLVKVAIQLEFGKHAILSGETAMKSFGKLPGPRFGRSGWALWSIFFLTLMKVIQVGGMLGGTAIVLSMLFPSVSVIIWAIMIALAVALLIFGGLYSVIEKSSLLMIAFFTLLTFASLFVVNFTPYRITGADLLSGLTFSLPSSLAIIAIGAFGITGVGSDEIIAYNYWCLEKGYAAYTGPRNDNDAGWKRRAQGWIRVMHLDALVAMIIYTLVTAAFYLLGASILHKQGLVPEGNQVIETLAVIYTHTFGNGIKTTYLIGAFFVLFSSVFATLAAWTRLFSDIFGQLGWINFYDNKQRRKTIAILSWIFPVVWVTAFAFIKLPVMMILFGGIVGSVMLLIVVFAAVHFRKQRIQYFRSHYLYELMFWLSVIAITAVAIGGLLKLSDL
jgi:Mn2+/Fe2+ NRAMP family transporter